MDHRGWAFLGTGGGSPSVLFWNGEESKLAAPGKPGQSIYRMAVSPDSRRVLVGTRNKAAGDQYAPVLVFERNHGGALETEPARSWFQPSFVTGLGALTEDLFVSSGYDGRISLWSFSDANKAVAQLSASPSPVLALCPLSASLFAATSADARLRLWDANLGQVVREVTLEGGGVGPAGLLSLAAVPDHGILVSLSPSGRVSLHDMENDLALRSKQPPPVPASAAEAVGEWLVFADTGSSRLVAQRLPDLSQELVAPLDRPAYALVPVSDDALLSIHTDGTGSVWMLGDRLELRSVLDVGNLRCGHGPPRRAQLEIGRKVREDKRKENLGRALELLRSGQHDQLRFELDHLSLEGMGLESLLLLAESYRAQALPLWELRARLALSLELDETPEHAVHEVTLAELLERLGEPEKARRVYERALRAGSDRADLTNKIQALEASEGPSTLPPHTIRDDLLMGPEALLQEVEKMAVLGIQWQWRASVNREESDLPFASSLGDTKVLAEHLGEEIWSPATVTVHSGSGGSRRAEWVSQTISTGPAQGWQFVVEPIQERERVRFAYRLLLVPEEKETVEATALALLSRIRTLRRDPGGLAFFQRLRQEVEARAKSAPTAGQSQKEF